MRRGLENVVTGMNDSICSTRLFILYIIEPEQTKKGVGILGNGFFSHFLIYQKT